MQKKQEFKASLGLNWGPYFQLKSSCVLPEDILAATTDRPSSQPG